MVKISVTIGESVNSFELANVTKRQAVDLIESLEIAVLKNLSGGQMTLCEQALSANVDDGNNNEYPVVFSGFIGWPLEYYIKIE